MSFLRITTKTLERAWRPAVRDELPSRLLLVRAALPAKCSWSGARDCARSNLRAEVTLISSTPDPSARDDAGIQPLRL